MISGNIKCKDLRRLSDMYKSFRANILRHQFIHEGDSVLVGVSGGVDSVVLASLLVALKNDIDFALSVAHVNYGLRGAESDAQEALVCEFARSKKLECFVSKAPSLKTAGDNFQSAARKFRYLYFSEVAVQIGANKVAVAHHLEDQVETILAHLLRGSSLKGLGGMKGMRSLRATVSLIRPLLSFSKEDLKNYASKNNIATLEDSSNASTKYWRNRLRQELLPVIQKLRPRAFEKIVRLGGEIRDWSDIVSDQAKEWLLAFAKKEEDKIWLPGPRLKKLPKMLRLEILHQAALSLKSDLADLKKDHLVRCDQLSHGGKSEGYYLLPDRLKFVRACDNLFFMLAPESK